MSTSAEASTPTSLKTGIIEAGSALADELDAAQAVIDQTRTQLQRELVVARREGDEQRIEWIEATLDDWIDYDDRLRPMVAVFEAARIPGVTVPDEPNASLAQELLGSGFSETGSELRPNQPTPAPDQSEQ